MGDFETFEVQYHPSHCLRFLVLHRHHRRHRRRHHHRRHRHHHHRHRHHRRHLHHRHPLKKVIRFCINN